ncbi:hypothetical protein [Clostridium celatum]|uniref:Uncharacterized protein n=1 Tax=Clostridium celatum DSM 1785 TaxID=545697 RepID=L1QHG3_9CLOT|nr:hypothetical protein [Clostridium celatum]EKY27403.1 hypothetical protein HMPREF0216_01436 [Clostridium celatum DSM 1785]MCE9655865.1 hypothetical protein [Clostridium celatum]MDU3723875.1 hypothetical protein [Clostridium celatum]MDU6295784.1 hypothetical protein [Clostridium celatum]MDY3362304.1 hypothetical protein [Clostridium celatum]
MSKDEGNISYSNGIIDGVIPCEEEERKLRHDRKPRSKLAVGGMFKFPDLNE